MSAIDRLQNVRGDARRLLGLAMTDTVEWSDAEGLDELAIVRDVRFDRFSFARTEVRVNFVACGFAHCTFSDLTTDTHLWAAQTRWTECDFVRCDLRRMHAPANTFERCRFDQVSLVNFKPHQTLFDDCSFSRTSFEGIRPHLVSNSQIVNHDLKGGGGQLLFRACRFDAVSFRQCYFDGVVFQRSIFQNTEAIACNIEGITSDIAWWNAQEIDPFSIFLAKALDLIRAKCGRESAACREFEAYTIAYGRGKTSDQDFSAHLYSDRVPYAETQKVINDLRKLMKAFPF